VDLERAKPTRWQTGCLLALGIRPLQQSENDMRCAAGNPAIGAHINAHTNAHINFPRTSVASEMARTPFCQLRTSFCLVAHIILSAAHAILPGGAHHLIVALRHRGAEEARQSRPRSWRTRDQSAFCPPLASATGGPRPMRTLKSIAPEASFGPLASSAAPGERLLATDLRTSQPVPAASIITFSYSLQEARTHDSNN
jgi:hypothetical protein